MGFSRKIKDKILSYDKYTERELMIVISLALDLYKVSKEIEELYESMSPNLWICLENKSRGSSNKNETDILLEDVFSDGWYKILINRDKYNKKDFPFPWAKKILINVYFNILKSFYERNKINIDDFSVESKESIAVIKNSSNELIVHGELKNTLQQKWDLVMKAAESELSPNEIDIFLKLAEGKKQREICKEIGIGESNFSKIKKKILGSIRLYFERNNLDIDYD